MPAGTEQYRLPWRTLERIFDEQIAPDLLANSPTQASPVTTVLVGPPGAGKTWYANELVKLANERPEGRSPANIDRDLCKPYHPRSGQQYDSEAIRAAVHADTLAWVAMAHDYVRRHRLDAIAHEGEPDPHRVNEEVANHRDFGRRVEVVFIPTPDALSAQGRLLRFNEQLRSGGEAHLLEDTRVQAAYENMVATADVLHESSSAHVLTVVRRGDRLRYRSELDADGRRIGQQHTGDAVRRELTWPLSKDEQAAFRKAQAKLRAELPAEYQPHVAAVDKMVAPLMEGTVPPRSTAASRGRPARTRGSSKTKPPGPTRPSGRSQGHGTHRTGPGDEPPQR